jgi:hypothetical protein
MLLDTHGVVDPTTLDPALPSVSLYNNEVQIIFDPMAHKYTVRDVQVDNGVPFFPPSVTKILKVIDKSDALVPWGARMAHEKFLELIRPGWPYSIEDIEHIGWAIRNAHKDALNDAGGVGKESHAWIENYLAARTGPSGYPAAPTEPRARACCRAARAWILKVDLRPFMTERILYSRRLGVVGIADAGSFQVLKETGRSAVIDWKTSNQLYPSYRFQLSAYRMMIREQIGITLDDRWLIRLDKDPEPSSDGFHPVCLPAGEADADEEAFVGLVAAYKQLNR